MIDMDLNNNFWPSGQGINVAAIMAEIEIVAAHLKKDVQTDDDIRFIYIDTARIGPITIVEESSQSERELGVFVDIKTQKNLYQNEIQKLLADMFNLIWHPSEISYT